MPLCVCCRHSFYVGMRNATTFFFLLFSFLALEKPLSQIFRVKLVGVRVGRGGVTYRRSPFGKTFILLFARIGLKAGIGVQSLLSWPSTFLPHESHYINADSFKSFLITLYVSSSITATGF